MLTLLFSSAEDKMKCPGALIAVAVWGMKIDDEQPEEFHFLSAPVLGLVIKSFVCNRALISCSIGTDIIATDIFCSADTNIICTVMKVKHRGHLSPPVSLLPFTQWGFQMDSMKPMLERTIAGRSTLWNSEKGLRMLLGSAVTQSSLGWMGWEQLGMTSLEVREKSWAPFIFLSHAHVWFLCLRVCLGSKNDYFPSKAY